MDTQPGALAELLSARLLVVTGKGGVGKTTVAAAFARVAADKGKRVLACEVDVEAGHPSRLCEALLGTALTGSAEPQEVAPGIDHVVLTADAGHRAFLRDILPFGFLADRAMKAEPVRRFLGAAPAFQELGVLYRGLQFLKVEKGGRPRWDLLVLDSPATGHALAFATLPEVMLKIIPGGPVGRAMREGLEVLTDPKRTMAVVTTLPEQLPVSEALELVAGLEKSRIQVKGVVANLVPHDPFDAEEHAALDDVFASDAGQKGILGHRSVGKLRRAKTALHRLRGEVGRAMFEIRETHERGVPLIEAVARELARHA